MSTNRGTALDAVMRILAGRSHGRAELRLKLETRGFENDAIAEALARAEELLLLEPEAELAKRYAAELAQKKGATPDRVQQQVEARGYAERDARAGVEAAFAEWDPLAAAKKVIGNESDPKRAARRLQQRGFSADVIAQVVRHFEPQE